MAAEAAKRWAKRSLAPTDQGVAKWEAQASDAGHARQWSSQLGRGLGGIGATAGGAYTEAYVHGNVAAARERAYSDGVSKAARTNKWKAGFLDGVNR